MVDSGYSRLGFQEQAGLLYGLHPNGVLEIKFNNPRIRNAFGMETQLKIVELYEYANKEDKVKVVFQHGGAYYSSGNDLGAFKRAFAQGIEHAMEQAKVGATVSMVKFLTATIDLEKPLVLMVSGGIFGLACT